MASENRLLGQDTLIRFVRNGSVVAELVDIQEFSVEFDRSVLEEGYAGEKFNRFVDIYNAMKGDISAHISDPKLIDLLDELNMRSQRKVVGIKIDSITVLPFPDGQSRKIIIPDLSFGSFSLRNGGRGGFHTFNTNWAASIYKKM